MAAGQAAPVLPVVTQVLDAGAGATPWSIAYVPNEGRSSRSVASYSFGHHLGQAAAVFTG
jgi:hypothetical protein